MPTGVAAEVCDAADRVLRARRHQIVNDELDGDFWAATCYREGIEIVRRRRTSERRRRAS